MISVRCTPCAWRVFVVAALMALAPLARAAEASGALDVLRERIERHVTQPRFSGALWGVKIASLATGRTLFEHHADRLMSPASNSKLYTGALALDRLGGDYRIVTPVLATVAPDAEGVVRGDLIVAGRGDPSWNSRRRSGADFWSIFEPVVDAVTQAGVRRVMGDVVADATYFRMPPNGAGWTADDLNDSYGAEVSAISVEQNYTEIRLAPGARAGEPVTHALAQPLTGLRIENRMTTVAGGGTWRMEHRRIFGEPTLYLFGEAPAGGEGQAIKVPVPRPAVWFAEGLREALRRRGVTVEGGARAVRWPETPVARPEHVVLGKAVSPPMRELVAAFMKPSQNLETDLVFGHIGESRRAAETPAWRGTEELAVEALEEFLRSNGLPAAEVRFEEGAGLSRNNLTTANATVALLAFMARHRAAGDFLASLPVAGEDGTLRSRMRGTAAAGNARAKTGTLRYAHALSGYVTTPTGERLAFSLMLNRSANQPAGRSAREELDDIAVWLAEFAGETR